MPEGTITREDVASAVGARRELGEDLEPAVVDAFLDRVERAIDARVKEEGKQRRKGGGGSDGQSLALAIVSLGTGIPTTAIAVAETRSGRPSPAPSRRELGAGIAWRVCRWPTMSGRTPVPLPATAQSVRRCPRPIA